MASGRENKHGERTRTRTRAAGRGNTCTQAAEGQPLSSGDRVHARGPLAEKLALKGFGKQPVEGFVVEVKRDGGGPRLFDVCFREKQEGSDFVRKEVLREIPRRRLEALGPETGRICSIVAFGRRGVWGRCARAHDGPCVLLCR